MNVSRYVGEELELFSHANHWKRYWSSQIRPYVRGDVLEVGAGLGVNTISLSSSRCSSWTCLEPDPDLALRMRDKFAAHPALAHCRVETGTTLTLDQQSMFDTVIYIDVLEHIENDRLELLRAAVLLRGRGHLIVLAPAYPWLYTHFDGAIGHVRRYTRSTLSACTPAGCDLERMLYLDSAGLLASIGSKLFLQQRLPTPKQILLWDGILVPISRVSDRFTFHQFGRSILAIWKKSQDSSRSIDCGAPRSET